MPDEKPDKRCVFADRDGYVFIKHGRAFFEFSKRLGALESMSLDGESILAEPLRLNIMRPKCYNGGSYQNWVDNDLWHVSQKTRSVELDSSDVVKVTIRGSLGAPSRPPIVRFTQTWEFFEKYVRIRLKGDIVDRKSIEFLPRLGFEFRFTDWARQIDYSGPGPYESYPDRYRACVFGAYETDFFRNFVHYIRPQENGSHYLTEELFIGGEKEELPIRFFGAPFSFGASRYTDEEIARAKHDFELKDSGMNILRIDFRVNGISENRLLARKDRRRLFDEKSFDCEIWLDTF